jgi:hypothetical protein
MRIFAEDTSLTAQASVRALSTTYFGTIHHQPNVVELGSVLYGKALRKLNDDLRDAEKAWSISVLKASITLELYEACRRISYYAIKMLTVAAGCI